jgi:hypothetical protein
VTPALDENVAAGAPLPISNAAAGSRKRNIKISGVVVLTNAAGLVILARRRNRAII